MSTITIHAGDYLAAAVRDYAVKMDKSINVAVKELLASASHLVRPAKRREPSSMKCCGILDSKSAEALRAAQADFDRVDAEMWKREARFLTQTF